jgi:hypothetical protein
MQKSIFSNHFSETLHNNIFIHDTVSKLSEKAPCCFNATFSQKDVVVSEHVFEMCQLQNQTWDGNAMIILRSTIGVLNFKNVQIKLGFHKGLARVVHSLVITYMYVHILWVLIYLKWMNNRFKMPKAFSCYISNIVHNIFASKVEISATYL